MAKQSSKAQFNVDVFGDDWDSVKTEETTFSKFGDLPSGIKGGIAVLKECKIGFYEKGDNEGKPFFYAHGTVVYPAKHKGQRVSGKLTKIGPEALCDTKKQDETIVTRKEHLSNMANELRKLGVPTANLKADKVIPAMNALLKKEVYFKFDTRGWTPPNSEDERVYHEWNGRLDAEEMEDLKKLLAEQGGEGVKEEDLSDEDIEELIEKAEADNDAAKKELEKRAIAAGYTSDDVQDAEDWDEVRTMIEKPKKGKKQTKKRKQKKQPEPEPVEDEEPDEEEESEEEEPDEEEPEDEEIDNEDNPEWNVGDMVKYHPPKRGGGFLKSPVNCKIVEIDEDADTADLLNVSTDKTYKGVSLDQIKE